MSENVISLKEARIEPIAEVVDALEGMLAEARAGTLRGYAIVTVGTESTHGTQFILGEGSISEYVCAIERLKLRLLRVGGDDLP